ncbi:MAG: hypothetical protein ACXQTD_00130 [Candidatus Syntropharchaeia archaeon]
MFGFLKKIISGIGKDKDLELFVKLHGAWTEIVLFGWDALMRKPDAEGREEEKQRILDEVDETRLLGGSVLAKMSEIINRYAGGERQ